MRSASRLLIRGRARERTAQAAGRSALVISPHPDDETLGCGATIARKAAAGQAVTVLMLTDGRHSHASDALSPEELGKLRRVEAEEAMRRLGLPADALRWADLVDGEVARHEDAVAELIGSLIQELRPDEIYVTCADEPHPDHAAAGRAARRASSGSGPELWEYPVWLWGAWPLRRGDRLGSTATAMRWWLRRAAVVVSADGYLATKQHALRAYESQLGRPAGVPLDQPWPGLPRRVLAAASEPVELFLPGDRHPA